MAEEKLFLKVGARVIMLKNDSEKRWVNGTIGEISHLTNCSIAVKINDEEYLVDREELEERTWQYLLPAVPAILEVTQ